MPCQQNKIYHAGFSSNAFARQGTSPHLRARNAIIWNFFDDDVSRRAERDCQDFVTDKSTREWNGEHLNTRVWLLIVSVRNIRYTLLSREISDILAGDLEKLLPSKIRFDSNVMERICMFLWGYRCQEYEGSYFLCDDASFFASSLGNYRCNCKVVLLAILTISYSMHT